MRLEILNEKDKVLSVTSKNIFVLRENSEIEVIPFAYNNLGMVTGIDEDKIVTIGYKHIDEADEKIFGDLTKVEF